jgi:hypothetical protein
MTGYARVDSVNNIADGNIINASDLDGEFDGVAAAFNSSTGHIHDGSAANGAPITKVGPAQDVVVSATTVLPKTTATLDIGSSGLKFKDFYFSGAGSVTGTITAGGFAGPINGTVGATTASTGAFTTLSASSTTTLSGLTASTALALDASKNVVSVTNTGTGSNVLATSPTLVTPVLGTPTSVTLTNATGLPISTGVSGLGANVATFLATPSSANLAAAVTDETGTGSLVFATSPTFVTPALGTPSSGVVTNLTGTASININGTVGATTANTGAFTTLSATGVTTVQAGTAALPAITTTGDTNTGIFFPAADTIAFTEGGVERARIDSSGNLGLGVTPSPWDTFTASFQIAGASLSGLGANNTALASNAYYQGGWKYYGTASASLYQQNAGQHAWSVAGSGTAGNAITFTQAMTLDSSGNVGIGTTSPSGKFHVSGGRSYFTANSEQFDIALKYNAGTSGVWLGSPGTDSFTVATEGGTERMRIDSSGNVGIGTSSPSSKLTVNNGNVEIQSGNSLLIRPADNSNDTRLVALTTGGLDVVWGGATSTSIMNWSNGGNVGIGTTSPIRKLTVSAAGTVEFVLQDTSQAANSRNWRVFNASNALFFGTLNDAGTAGNDYLVINSSGNVGIGTITPTTGYKLNVGSTSAVLTLEGAAITLFTSGGLTSSVGGVLNFRPQLGTTINDIFNLSICAYDHSGDGNADGLSINGSDGVSFSTGGNSRSERMRINSSGNVGIGTSSPSGKLDVRGASYFGTPNTFIIGDDGGSDGAFFNETASLPMRFLTAGSERMRIDSSGHVLVGTTSSDGTAVGVRLFGTNQVQASKSGDWSFRMGRRDSTGIITEVYYNSTRVGDIATNGTGTTYNSASDYRLKENVQPMVGALARVGALKPVTFTWKSTSTNDEGFLAHELQAVVPQAVRGEKDEVDADGKPVYQSIDTSVLVATLTAAIQEQQALITSLTARIAALESN